MNALRNPVGTHVKVGAGLVRGALADAEAIGCEAIQVFVGNPRGWARSAGDPAVDAEFRRETERRGLRTFVHASYLVNLGSPTPSTYEKSVASVGHDVQRRSERPLHFVGADRLGHGPAHLDTDLLGHLLGLIGG